MTDRELMQMALDALEDVGDEWGFTSQRTLPKRMNVIEALRAQLSQPEREWQGLTPEEAKEISLANRPYVVDMIAALEARLKEKNT
jgi:hypothetical protein